MAENAQGEKYTTPTVTDFGSLWENTFLNPGGHIKLNGTNLDAHTELADGS